MTIQITVHSEDLYSIGIWKGRRFKVKEVKLFEQSKKKALSCYKQYICFDKNSSTGIVVIYYDECKIIKH